jgi:hypothetical protein
LLSWTFIARLLGIGDAQSQDERGRRDPTGGDEYFLHFAVGSAENGLCPLRSNFGRKFAPDSIHSRERDGWGHIRLAELGGIAMGPAYPPDRKQEFLDQQKCLDQSPVRAEEYTDDGYSDGVISLLEENAQLRGLVIKLTDLILKNVTDRT